MKKLILLIISCFFIINVNSQAVLENRFDTTNNISGPFFTNSYGPVYAVINYITYLISIYDIDYNLIKSVTVPAIPNFPPAYVYNVSDNLFNNDSKLELLVLVETGYYFDILLINEDNQVLQTFPSQQCMKIYEINGAFKMMTGGYENDLSSSYIYALPGSTILNVREELLNQNKIFPNPASKNINISCSEDAREMVVYGMAGIEIFRKKINGAGFQKLNVSQFLPGTYIYKITSSNGIISTGKFEVIK